LAAAAAPARRLFMIGLAVFTGAAFVAGPAGNAGAAAYLALGSTPKRETEPDNQVESRWRANRIVQLWHRLRVPKLHNRVRLAGAGRSRG
jgi:hypothetical protein